jgi:hypothetical protein
VDHALLHNIPFCVVPCCVFPKMFPNRRLPDGSNVNKYDEFLQYLKGKDERIKVEELGFGGRNKVVYMFIDATKEEGEVEVVEVVDIMTTMYWLMKRALAASEGADF